LGGCRERVGRDREGVERWLGVGRRQGMFSLIPYPKTDRNSNERSVVCARGTGRGGGRELREEAG
jgi:hypothetical protein